MGPCGDCHFATVSSPSRTERLNLGPGIDADPKLVVSRHAIEVVLIIVAVPEYFTPSGSGSKRRYFRLFNDRVDNMVSFSHGIVEK